MQKFKFKLETVLKHRAVLEEQSMRAFATAQGELAACVARIAVLQMEFQQVVANRSKNFEVEEIALRERHLDTLRGRIEQQERLREGLEARMDDARKHLVKSRQDREMVERLRQIKLAEHAAKALKVDQDAIDEMATLRHGRSR